MVRWQHGPRERALAGDRVSENDGECGECGECGAPVNPLEVFPARASKKGVQCLACYAQSPEGRQMPTAQEIRRMWGT